MKVDIDLGIKKGLVFYQTRSNAIILQGTLPAHCIVKIERLKMERNCMKGNICPTTKDLFETRSQLDTRK